MTTDTITITVPGMTCGHCESAVKTEIGKLTGVTDVHVDLATKLVTVTVTVDANAGDSAGVSLDDLAAAVDEAGFEIAAGSVNVGSAGDGVARDGSPGSGVR